MLWYCLWLMKIDHPFVLPADDPRGGIVAALRAEISSPQAADIVAFARDVANRYGDAVAAVLFYGACLRNPSTEGLFDFYVVVDGYPEMSISASGAAAARVLPPNVYHHA